MLLCSYKEQNKTTANGSKDQIKGVSHSRVFVLQQSQQLNNALPTQLRKGDFIGSLRLNGAVKIYQICRPWGQSTLGRGRTGHTWGVVYPLGRAVVSRKILPQETSVPVIKPSVRQSCCPRGIVPFGIDTGKEPGHDNHCQPQVCVLDLHTGWYICKDYTTIGRVGG